MKAIILGRHAHLMMHRFFFGLVLLVSTFALLSVSGCGGSSSKDDDAEDTQQVTVPRGNEAKNVQFVAGKPVEIKFTLGIPGSMIALGEGSVDLTGTLNNASFSAAPVPRGSRLGETLRLLAKALIKDAFAADTMQMSAHISFAGDPNVCSSSIVFGPYSITGGIGMALTSPTESVSPTQQTTNMMNAGSIEVCFVTTPSIDAFVTLTAMEVEMEPCAEPTVSIADSSWSGTFQCANFGVADTPPGTMVNLTITQNPDGSYHYIDNFGAAYDGHLCGNRFQYNGLLAGSYTESGTMVFSSATAATKSSTWNGIPAGAEGGNCSDTLSR